MRKTWFSLLSVLGLGHFINEHRAVEYITCCYFANEVSDLVSTNTSRGPQQYSDSQKTIRPSPSGLHGRQSHKWDLAWGKGSRRSVGIARTLFSAWWLLVVASDTTKMLCSMLSECDTEHGSRHLDQKWRPSLGCYLNQSCSNFSLHFTSFVTIVFALWPPAPQFT